jgi:hypothetical protein
MFGFGIKLYRQPTKFTCYGEVRKRLVRACIHDSDYRALLIGEKGVLLEIKAIIGVVYSIVRIEYTPHAWEKL